MIETFYYLIGATDIVLWVFFGLSAFIFLVLAGYPKQLPTGFKELKACAAAGAVLTLVVAVLVPSHSQIKELRAAATAPQVVCGGE